MSSARSASTPRGRGRPRDRALDDAVLRATIELLAEVSYKRLTFDAIVLRSGVAKPTIYLRWPSKAHLVHDAVFGVEPPIIDDSGDFAADLKGFVARTVAHLDRPEVRPAYFGLLGEMDEDPTTVGLGSGWVASRGALERRVATGIAQGELRPDADVSFVLSCIVGSLLHHVVVQRRQGAEVEAFGERLADMLLATELRSPEAG